MARRRLTDTDCTETLRVSSSSEVAGWTCKECFYFLTLSPGLGRETKEVEGEEEERLRNYFDYQTLMLKRSSRSKFMPNAFVFPGGVLAEADTSEEWLTLLREQGHTDDDLEELVLRDVDRPFLMSKADVSEAVARDIGLR